MSKVTHLLLTKIVNSTSLETAKAYAECALLFMNESEKVDVVYECHGERKIDAIKLIREELNIGLREAKDWSEAPQRIEGAHRAWAIKFVSQLETLGCKVRIE